MGLEFVGLEMSFCGSKDVILWDGPPKPAEEGYDECPAKPAEELYG